MDLSNVLIYKYRNNSSIFLLNKNYEGVTLSINWRGILKIEKHVPFSRSKNIYFELKKYHYFNSEELRLIQRHFNISPSKIQKFTDKHKYKDLYIVKLPKQNKYQIIYGNKTFAFKDNSGFESFSEGSENTTLETIMTRVKHGDYSFDFTFDEISFIKKNRKFKELDENIYDFLENEVNENPLYSTKHDDTDVLNYQFYKPIKEFKLYKMKDIIYLLDISLNGYYLHVNGISPVSNHSKSINKKEFIEVKEFFFTPRQRNSFKLYFNDEDISNFIEDYRYKDIHFGFLENKNIKVMAVNDRALDITNLIELPEKNYYKSILLEENNIIDDKKLKLTNKEMTFIKRYMKSNQFDYFLELRKRKEFIQEREYENELLRPKGAEFLWATKK